MRVKCFLNHRLNIFYYRAELSLRNIRTYVVQIRFHNYSLSVCSIPRLWKSLRNKVFHSYDIYLYTLNDVDKILWLHVPLHSDKAVTPSDTVMCCRIWSWSPMPCEKHGPMDSVDKSEAEGRDFSRYWSPRAMFFTRNGRPWSHLIIARALIDICRVLFT